MKKKEFGPIALFIISIALMAISIALKSMLVIAGATGLIVAWFLCIDKLIAGTGNKASVAYNAVLAMVALGLPIAIAAYLG